ncbi:DNA topoisomerase IV subunit A [Candidatus Woesearchaeota archaeon]|nr:DNA topoisomerase IV subunit A [Candidatus Woesearchaeota archaeon]
MKMPKSKVQDKELPRQSLIELGKKLAEDIEKGRNPSIEVSVRALSNVSFDKKTKKLSLGERTATREFFNVAHIRKFTQTMAVARIAKKELLDRGLHASLRDIYYQAKKTIPGTDINIVDEQQETDSAIEDLEIVTGYSREQLHINANKMGSVAGKVIIEDKGDTIDWSRLGSGGWSIPSNVEDIEFKKVSAKYVVYMEKAAVWERLHEDKFWDKQNCIILSSQGQTTRGIRRLLQRLRTEHELPIYILTDFDPYGIYIYSVIKFGSISLAHMSETLALPDVKFLGISADDIKNYGLTNAIRLKDVDISRLKQLSEYDWFKNSKAWQRQFKMMKDMNGKYEIQALSSRGITFISEKYLPEKIRKEDFID